MKACLIACVFSSVSAWLDVPLGKAIIETREYRGVQQCAGDKVQSTFEVDQDKCLPLARVPTSVINTDQILHCRDDEYFEITTYESIDGSCTDTKPEKSVHRKDSCLLNKDSRIAGVFVRCPDAKKKQNIVELAESVKDLSTLVSAVVAGDLVDTLSSPGPFTVFAPTNEGFADLPAGTLDSLMKPENKAQLVDILTYHVLPLQAFSKDLALFQEVETVEGKKLHVQKWGGGVKVGPSLESKDLKTVTVADNAASNGVVHIIDGVLLPPQSALAV
jgi:uncharacterized surface protein with fasciclin (FAS1) repeats